MLYKLLLHCNNHLKRRNASVIMVSVVDIDVRVSSHLKEEQAWAVGKRLRVISTIMLFNIQGIIFAAPGF